MVRFGLALADDVTGAREGGGGDDSGTAEPTHMLCDKCLSHVVHANCVL